MARQTSSKRLRELCRETMPGLDKNPAYWRLLHWSLFGPEEDGLVYIPARKLAQFEGKEKQYASNNYRSATLIERFQRDVWPVGVQQWVYSQDGTECRPRSVEVSSLPADVLALAEEELRMPVTKLVERVEFVSGRKWHPQRQKQYQTAAREESLLMLDNSGCVLAREAIQYLNDRPTNSFTAMLAHLDEARSEARQIENKQTRREALRSLAAIEENPKPLYVPSESGRTVRFFSAMQRLPREVRKRLTQDWVSVDLKSAQLAIVARLWDIPLVEGFLASGESVWGYLQDELELVRSEENKAIVKQALYATVFGGERSKRGAVHRDVGLKLLGDATFAERFYAIPLIDELYKAREGAANRILLDGGSADAFGNWVSIPADRNGKPRPRSTLASIAQSYELYLLEPVFREAFNGKGVAIQLYLFDGLCLSFTDRQRAAAKLERLQEKVEARAKGFGMLTALEVEA